MLTYLSYVLGTTVFFSIIALVTVGVMLIGDKIGECFDGKKSELARLIYYFLLLCIFVGSFLYGVDYFGGKL